MSLPGLPGLEDWALLAVLVLSGALVAYVYLGYPALLWVLARLRPRPVAFGLVRPPVTFVVPAHDEEASIGAKIDDCLAQRYPPDRLEVVVVSDGSTDGTEAIVRGRAARDPRVRLLAVPRGGKALALNAGARAARGEVLVLTDANALLAPEALVRLVEPFADPEVGGVCGRKRHRPAGEGDATARGEGLYWRWEQWQKSLESRIGSVYAADGTLYAVRRSLYVPIAEPAQADDIAVSARVPLAGRRLLFEPAAVAWEEPPAEGRAELRRKVRVTNHSLRALWNLGPRLWRSGFYSVELLSHKLLRHLLPFPLLALLVTNAALVLRLAPGPEAAWSGALSGPAGTPGLLWPLLVLLLAAQGALYALGLAGFLLRGTRAGGLPFLSIPYYFSMVNLAAFLGALSVLRGVRPALWTPRKGL
ncbi:MAG: glycosyltransferase family 2 protein [Thermoanaerobaculia bacterium]